MAFEIWTRWTYITKGPSCGSCENGNEAPESIKKLGISRPILKLLIISIFLICKYLEK
jgi:hypothetical protein